MSVTGFSCPTCGAPLDATATDSPTQTCKYCGTAVKNPFYKGGASSGQIAMPVININVGQNMYAGQPAPVAGAPHKAESYRNWTVTFLLCLFLGIFGAHRFYTGHVMVGLIQLFTLGFGGLWTLIDMILILTGVYRDHDGLPLSGKRPGVRLAMLILLVVVGCCVASCVGLILIGENASKVDVPAKEGWITGIDRCAGTNAFGEAALQDNVNLWSDWDMDEAHIIGTVAHNTRVEVLEGRRDTSTDITYYKVRTDSGLTGWVNASFIQFQSLDEGVVPLDDC